MTHSFLLTWFSSRLTPAQVRPACLPMYGQRFQTGRSCFITGFGKTRENEGEGRRGLSCVLQRARGASVALLWYSRAVPTVQETSFFPHCCRNAGAGGVSGVLGAQGPPCPTAPPALQITHPRSCGRLR